MWKYILIIIVLISTILCLDKLYVDKIIIHDNLFYSDDDLYGILKLKEGAVLIRSFNDVLIESFMN